MHCPNCGHKIDKNMRFCPYCGTKITVQEQPSQTRSQHIRNICLTIIATVLAIAAVITVFFTVQNQRNNSSTNQPRISSSKRTNSNKTNQQSNSNNSKSNTSSRNSASSESSNSKTAKSNNGQLIWNNAKEKELASFMTSFGNKMDQKYKEYTGGHQLKTFSGEDYPSILSKIPFKLYADGSNKTQKLNIGWDPQLNKDYDYHVVSIFNYNEGRPELHITYLFCIHDNEPVALVDQSTNGNFVAVKETGNQNLRTGYANIVKENN